MNSKQKFEENGDVLPDWVRGGNHTLAGNSSNKGVLHGYDAKPAHYNNEKSKKSERIRPEQYLIGTDTFDRAETNMDLKEILACCRFAIDKYTWRKKNQDLQDFKKIIDYANFAIKQLEK